MAAVVCLAALSFLTAPVLAKKKTKPTVSTEFYGYADFELYSTYSWREGTTARDPSLERGMRDTVDAIMQKKGWLLVADDPNIWLMSESKSFGTALGMGAIQLNVIDGPTKNLAWRGLAANMAPMTRDSLPKFVNSIMKQMLKDFPKAAAQ